VTTCYELTCTDCSFETVVVGPFPRAIEASEAHRTEHEVTPSTHFVNVHRRT
jgi:hypothetical protein